MTSKQEAIAMANAHLSNAGLPTFDAMEMCLRLAAARVKIANEEGQDILKGWREVQAEPLLEKIGGAK